mgnify:CR=1 FL=1
MQNHKLWFLIASCFWVTHTTAQIKDELLHFDPESELTGYSYITCANPDKKELAVIRSWGSQFDFFRSRFMLLDSNFEWVAGPSEIRTGCHEMNYVNGKYHIVCHTTETTYNGDVGPPLGVLTGDGKEWSFGNADRAEHGWSSYYKGVSAIATTNSVLVFFHGINEVARVENIPGGPVVLLDSNRVLAFDESQEKRFLVIDSTGPVLTKPNRFFPRHGRVQFVRTPKKEVLVWRWDVDSLLFLNQTLEVAKRISLDLKESEQILAVSCVDDRIYVSTHSNTFLGGNGMGKLACYDEDFKMIWTSEHASTGITSVTKSSGFLIVAGWQGRFSFVKSLDASTGKDVYNRADIDIHDFNMTGTKQAIARLKVENTGSDIIESFYTLFAYEVNRGSSRGGDLFVTEYDYHRVDSIQVLPGETKWVTLQFRNYRSSYEIEQVIVGMPNNRTSLSGVHMVDLGSPGIRPKEPEIYVWRNRYMIGALENSDFTLKVIGMNGKVCQIIDNQPIGYLAVEPGFYVLQFESEKYSVLKKIVVYY